MATLWIWLCLIVGGLLGGGWGILGGFFFAGIVMSIVEG